MATATTNTTTTNSVKRVEGVDLACADEATVAKFCAKYSVAIDGLDLAGRVAALAKAIKASTPKTKLADCDSCGGDSNVEDDVCPYCGIGGFEGPAPVKPTPAQVALPIAPAPASTPEPAPEPTKPAPKKRSEAKKTNGASAKPAPAPEPELATEPKPAKAPKAPKAKPAPAPAPEPESTPELAPEPAVVVAPAAEVVPNGSASIALDGRTVFDMVEVQASRLASTRTPSVDEAVEGVREAKRLAVVCYWQLGASILKCFEHDVWKQRRDDKGQPVYRGFAQFVEAELEMSPQYAYKLMDIAASFSATDVAKIGVAKLGVMLRLPPGERDKLLDEVRNGMPFTAVAAQVRKLAGAAGEHRSGRGKKDTSKATDAAAAAKATAAADIVTGTFEAKRVKVPLFARATTKGADPKRAKRLGDDPWGELVLLNGVTLRIALSHDTEGRLIAIVEARRPEKK